MRLRILLPILLGAAMIGLASWRGSAARADEPDCMGCHGRADIAKEGLPVLDAERMQAGVHAKLACTLCHEASGVDGFAVVPHRLAPDARPPTCADCHDDDFEEIIDEHAKSVHATKLEGWGCVRCHDPHTMSKDLEALPREKRVAQANRACLRCHRDSVYRVVGRRDGHTPSTSHDWLPSLEKHARMRCIVCHTPIENDHDHDILPMAQATRSCTACHAPDAPLIQKYLPADDRSTWVTNPVLFEEAYVPGAVRNRLVDGILLGLAAFAVLGIAIHLTLRIVAGRGREERPFEVEKIYLYSGSVRLWHWSNAILFLLLAATGFRMHFGGQHAPFLSFETAFNVHNLAGALLVFVGLWFFVSNAISGNGRQYSKAHPAGFPGLLAQARWYLVGIFKGDPHPYHASKEQKFNPLQRLAYRGVMYVLYPLLLLTGIVLLFPGILPRHFLGHPGAWWFAAAHYLLAAFGTLFLIGHLYLATTGDRPGTLLSGMFTGWHESHTPKDG